MKKFANELIYKLQSSNSRKRKIVSLLELDKLNGYNTEIYELKKRLNANLQYDPLHREYIIVQNLVSIFSEEIIQYKEFRNFAKKVKYLEEKYMPSGPPWSPLTNSYFVYWMFFDYKIEGLDETLGSIFYDCCDKLNINKDKLQALAFCNDSRMGFYKQIKIDGKFVILKELGTNEEIKCYSSSGYKGKKNEIWYSRILKNFIDINDYSIMVTTPYVIINYDENDWIKYFERNSVYINGKFNEEAAQKLLKYGPLDNYWNEYLMDAYSNYESDHIRLTGIPDIKGTKPHESN